MFCYHFMFLIIFFFPTMMSNVHSSSYGPSIKENLGSLKLDVDRIALTERKQRQKLSVILEAVAKCLQLEESQLKWSVECRCRSEIEENDPSQASCAIRLLWGNVLPAQWLNNLFSITSWIKSEKYLTLPGSASSKYVACGSPKSPQHPCVPHF